MECASTDCTKSPPPAIDRLGGYEPACRRSISTVSSSGAIDVETFMASNQIRSSPPITTSLTFARNPCLGTVAQFIAFGARRKDMTKLLGHAIQSTVDTDPPASELLSCNVQQKATYNAPGHVPPG